MKLDKRFATLLLTLGLAMGSQMIWEAEAEAKPFSTLAGSRKGGKRTHKKADSSEKSSDSEKKKSSRSSSSSNRRVVHRTTTRSQPRSSGSHTTGRRTSTYRKPAGSNTTTTRRTTTSRPSTRTTTRRTTTTTQRPTTTHTTRTTTTRKRRGATSRRTTYRSGHHHHRSSHTHVSASGSSHSSGSTSLRRNETRPTVEAYVTGGLGVSGFASNEITDLPLPGFGYNLAVGAKGKLFGGELGLNGGGYTFDPSNAAADIATIGLSADLKLQPAFGFFEPFIAVGLGGYALNDAIIDETATGLGLRLGAGADFRYENFAFRLAYNHGSYGLHDTNGMYDGELGARTETISGAFVVYF